MRCSPFCLALALTAPLWAQDAAPATLDPRVEALVEGVRKRQQIPAISVAIARSKKIVFERGFGLADVENEVPARTDTRYRTASIAKPMTAVAVMKLVEQGKLDLDSPIQGVCPEYPKKKWPVTVRQLLAHLGGVRHYRQRSEAIGTRSFVSVAESLELFKDDPLLHEPGTKHHYSTYGYSLLGRAVETASGLSFSAYMKRWVFAPAAMTGTHVDEHYRIVPHRAQGYGPLTKAMFDRLPAELRAGRKVGEIVNAALHDSSKTLPGAGLLSTAGDLVRFGIAVHSAKIVSAASRDTMWAAQTTRDGRATRYGLGWELAGSEGDRVVMHRGRAPGAGCILLILPADNVVVAIMTNMESARLGRLALRLCEEVLRD